jgi:hypothetical protein
MEDNYIKRMRHMAEQDSIKVRASPHKLKTLEFDCRYQENRLRIIYMSFVKKKLHMEGVTPFGRMECSKMTVSRRHVYTVAQKESQIITLHSASDRVFEAT